MPKTFQQQMDEDEARFQALRGGAVDPIDAAMAAVKQRAAAEQIAHLAEVSAEPGQEEQRLQRESTLGGQIAAHPFRTAKEGAIGAALPLAFAGGPMGATAGGLLSVDALNSLMQDENAGALEYSLAGLGLIPGARMARKAMKATRGAKPATAAPGYRASDIGAARTSTTTPSEPIQSMRWSDWSQGRPAPVTPLQAPAPAVASPAAQASLPSLDALQAAADAEAGAIAGTKGTQPATMSFLDKLHQETIAKARPPVSATPQAPTGRPPKSFVHPADTAGAEFGFEKLPKISEGELARLQAVFRKLGL